LVENFDISRILQYSAIVQFESKRGRRDKEMNTQKIQLQKQRTKCKEVKDAHMLPKHLIK
jgi:hypothetical protein